MAKLRPSQQRRILKESERSARANRPRISRILKRLGPIGGLIQAIADAIAGSSQQPSQLDIDQAVDILRGQGFEVRAPGDPEPPPIPGQVRQVPAAPTPPRVRGATSERRPPAEVFPEESTLQTLPVRVRGAFESIPADVEGFSPWILVDSSNVYAVAYDDIGILYVAYRAEGKPIGYKQGISICSGKEYRIGIRAPVPGPVYSYGSVGRPVPKSIFNTLVSTRSPGKVVWDQLRQCGSQHEHKYVYSLVDVPVGQPVPRKATRRGLRIRNVPNVGLGRRGSRRSTLPERIRR